MSINSESIPERIWILEDDLKRSLPLVSLANPLRRDAVEYVRAPTVSADIQLLARECAEKIMDHFLTVEKEELPDSREIRSIITSVFTSSALYRAAFRAGIEAAAKVAGTDRWAPTDYGGLCLECREWTPARHPERWEHKESCSWFATEYKKNERIAAAISALISTVPEGEGREQEDKEDFGK